MDVSTVLNYVLALFSIGLSIFFFFRTREIKDPRVYYRTYRDIVKLSHDNDDVHLYYKDQKVDRVFTTYLWFWNQGRRPILGSDIPEQSAIELEFSDPSHPLQILDFNLIKRSRSETDFSVRKLDDVKLEIAFEFLDQNDGGVIEVQHTGGYNTCVKSDGVILGVTDGIRIRDNEREFDTSTANPRNSKDRPRPRKFISTSFRQQYDLIFMFLAACVMAWGFYVLLWPNEDASNLEITTSQELEHILESILDLERTQVDEVLNVATLETNSNRWQQIGMTIVRVVCGIWIVSAFVTIVFGAFSSRNIFPKTLNFDLDDKSNPPMPDDLSSSAP